jgi:trk system potassium uptake protein TrkA
VPERLDDLPVEALGFENKFDLKLLGVMRGTEFHRPDTAGLRLAKGDKLIVLGKRSELRRFGDKV